MSAARELHAEHLLGRKVRDVNGDAVGRLEEFLIEVIDGEPSIVEFHFGPEALLERFGTFARKLPFFKWIPGSKRQMRAPWTVMDLRDAEHPRLRCSKRELEQTQR